jgi:hypothetical protein
MADRTNEAGWRIESRQLGVSLFGGHNYLALIDPDGVLKDEIHGWVHEDGKMWFTPINEKSRPEDLEVRYKQPEIEGAEVEVPLHGRDAEDVWRDLVKTAQEHNRIHRYD